MYEKEEQKEAQRKRDILKEAKKLKHFLEDYDDAKDDPKYYKSSSLFKRRRDFEKEKEEDAKDRQREHQEIEELKKQILAEGNDIDADEEARKRHQAQEDALLKKMRADSSPNPHLPLGQKPPVEKEEGEDESSSSSEESEDDENSKEPPVIGWTTVDTPASGTPGGSTNLGPPGRSASNTPNSPSVQPAQERKIVIQIKPKLNGVFGEDVDDDDRHVARKKLKPFEITKEERMQSMTAEEKKKLIKELIDGIPTAKEELFARSIDWNVVDKHLIQSRVRPWVSKKISDYIGEDEPTLVDFVCEKIEGRTSPEKILSDISMVLDDEAEVFVVKMWRLLIYESEAKKLGLPVK